MSETRIRTQDYEDVQDEADFESVAAGASETVVLSFRTLTGLKGRINHIGNVIAAGYEDDITWTVKVNGVPLPGYTNQKRQFADLWASDTVAKKLPVGQGQLIEVVASNANGADAVRCDARVVVVYE